MEKYDMKDRWTQEEFEDQIETMIDAIYHTGISAKARVKPPKPARLTDEILAGAREIGPYMPAKDRIVLDHFDTVNDPLPESICVSIPAHG